MIRVYGFSFEAADVPGSRRSHPRLQLQKDVGDIKKWFYQRLLSIFNPQKTRFWPYFQLWDVPDKLATFFWLLLMLLNRLLVTDAAAASLPRISDLFGLCPFKVFPPVRQPRGAKPDRAGRQSGLHEVDGRSRSGRLTRANLGPNHSEDPQPAVFNSSG